MKNVHPSPKDRSQLPYAVVRSASHTTAVVPHLISHGAVLPEQFFNLPDGCSKGEAALMCAVFEDAFNCFAKQFAAKDPHAQRLAREAEEWFFSKEECWPFSFVNICIVLSLDPKYVRKGLRQWQRQRPDQIKRIRKKVVNRPLSFRTAA